MHVAAIIVAAGKGERLGESRAKQFLELSPGRTMLDMSVEAFAGSGLVNEIVVALPPGEQGSVPFSGTRGNGDCPLFPVDGGARRQDSVANAFARVSPDADIIVIHDAARPFVSRSLIERTIAAARDHGAAIAALPALDTVKQVAAGEADGSRVVSATLPRESIFLAQTPQAFRRDVLAHAMAASAETTVTDEAMLVERAGYPVHIVAGDLQNLKVTTPDDLARARQVLAARSAESASTLRVGTGYDLHRLAEHRPLILAGVRIPFDRGLAGHSDADVVCHAVTDAVLGAVCAGDIGRLFPDTDPKWKDADSIQLLRSAIEVVREAGFTIGNVDVTVIAERPKLLPFLDEMRGNLAAALGVAVSAVSIKGKTNEGVGEIGRGEAIACHAVAALVARS